MDTGDAAWLLISAALVLFMVPGLALFYGGMVRAKHMLNMLMMNVYCLGIVPVVWAIVGYSLVLGSNSGGSGFVGGFDLVGMKGLSASTDAATYLGAAFALTFAVITPALISGAVADRMKFAAWAVFVPLWVVLVYGPVGTWLWGGDGWITARGGLDFAGGLVVHINAGVAALVAVLVLGKRKGWPTDAMTPHNLPFTLVGAGILWFGWFGFNAGSALAANDVAMMAFWNTYLAGAAGLLGWVLAEWLKDGHPTTLGAASGAVAGLVCVTPAAGFIGGMAGLAFGFAAGVVCYFAVSIKYKAGYDDSLDVVGVHLVGGLLGTLMLGLFADASAVGGEFHDGLLFGGGATLLGEQALGALATLAYSGGVTFVILKAIDATIGLRVSEDDEVRGLDLSQHAETAYNFGDLG
jgi:Amt family ammonium transporter